MVLRLLMFIFVSLGLLLTTASFAQTLKHHDKKVVQTVQAGKKININTVDEVTLQQVKGIGPKRAKLIIAYRKAHGPFKSVSDLTSVKGVGSKMLAKVSKQLTVN